ncbi:hypothetical protein GCM10010249_05860 [Streptomyces roseolilacinus]|uniref:Uncharacterized protein n=1 Tax=Streptomyces roseolilacinus TaxID=66904 RepID=A0A918AVK4_9ACTN|nr:hypothetical protein GCM10010249_05860 [Streptomyces roseolilacinus]
MPGEDGRLQDGRPQGVGAEGGRGDGWWWFPHGRPPGERHTEGGSVPRMPSGGAAAEGGDAPNLRAARLAAREYDGLVAAPDRVRPDLPVACPVRVRRVANMSHV